MAESPMLSHVVKAIDDKRAENIVILNMKGISPIADYFVICHGNSDKQVQAIALALKKIPLEHGIEIKQLEGYDHARWVLVDLGDIVVHVFHESERLYYNLEKLWGDAPIVKLEGVLE